MLELYPILILLVSVSMQSFAGDVHYDAQLHRSVDSRDSSKIQALEPF